MTSNEVNQSKNKSEPGCSSYIIGFGIFFLFLALVSGLTTKCMGGFFKESFLRELSGSSAIVVIAALILILGLIFKGIFKKSK
jgi:hypothetical protein